VAITPTFTQLTIIGGCNETFVPINAITYTLIGTAVVSVPLTASTANCATISAWLAPTFECNGCNNLGEVGVTVNWSSYGTSGNVTISVDGMPQATLPAVFGTATITVPASGQTIEITICDAVNEDCCDTVELTLPDCT
jgi:hypothetical protein